MSFAQERERAGLTQKEVADELGISSAAVSYWETGKYKPRGDLLIALANLYSCSIDKLLDVGSDINVPE